MTKNPKDERSGSRPAGPLPKGLRDIEARELRETWAMIEKIRAVYERYGFEPLETPAFEYTEALGKFLPDDDRPNEGVFSFQDEDDQWLSLRYDLTAPLARYVADNFQRLPKPFRRYAVGNVWRNEKPGPGRFRQFMQFDADTVGTATDSVAADAEMCMLAADTMEALGIKRGDYVIKVNSRKVLDGALEAAGVPGSQRLIVLRAFDKLDRIGPKGVRELLGPGRKDESGDFTKGAGLSESKITTLFDFIGGEAEAWVAWNEDQLPTSDEMRKKGRDLFPHRTDAEGQAAWGKDFYPDQNELLRLWSGTIGHTQAGSEGLGELLQILELVRSCGYGSNRIQISSSVVRGLEYYTGPVFEAELTFPIEGEDGKPVRFGSVGGGGRYDDLVARFTGERVPATGFSIGVSRLRAALATLKKSESTQADGPVVVTVMDRVEIPRYQSMVQKLRAAGICAELYLGNPRKFGRQLEYADKRRAPIAIIQGSNERNADPPLVTLKDLVEGAKAAAAIKDNREWKEARPAQVTVPESDLVAEVRKILARHHP